MSSYVSDGLGQARLSLALMTGFGAVALVLAVVGVYGVISYSVGQRTREIGIRMALGARPGRVRTSILVQGLRLILPSLAIGSAGAWILSHFIGGLLFETDAADPLTFAAHGAAPPGRRAGRLLRARPPGHDGQPVDGVAGRLEPRSRIHGSGHGTRTTRIRATS